MIRPFLLLVLAIFSVRAEAGQISGQGKAIDLQIIQIGDTRVMLFGVDFVMRKQTCELDGKPWQCWSAAVRDLQSLLDQGPVTCEPVGEPDVYGRVLARCLVNGQSLNEELVSRGFAIARPSESTDYVAAEETAKEKKLGLWQGKFRSPSEFRMGAGVSGRAALSSTETTSGRSSQRRQLQPIQSRTETIMCIDASLPQTTKARFAAMAAVGALLITACVVSPTRGLANDVAEGQRVWAEKAQCPECHGWAGNGERGSLHSQGQAPSLRLTHLLAIRSG